MMLGEHDELVAAGASRRVLVPRVAATAIATLRSTGRRPRAKRSLTALSRRSRGRDGVRQRVARLAADGLVERRSAERVGQPGQRVVARAVQAPSLGPDGGREPPTCAPSLPVVRELRSDRRRLALERRAIPISAPSLTHRAPPAGPTGPPRRSRAATPPRAPGRRPAGEPQRPALPPSPRPDLRSAGSASRRSRPPAITVSTPWATERRRSASRCSVRSRTSARHWVVRPSASRSRMRTDRESDAELLAEQAVDLAAVGAALASRA